MISSSTPDQNVVQILLINETFDIIISQSSQHESMSSYVMYEIKDSDDVLGYCKFASLGENQNNMRVQECVICTSEQILHRVRFA